MKNILVAALCAAAASILATSPIATASDRRAGSQTKLVSAPRVSATTTPSGAHVPHFNILSTPVKLSEIPRALRTPFDRLPTGKQRRLRIGRVHLNGTTITAIGNHHQICYLAWRRGFGGGGSCSRFSDALARGLSSVAICGGVQPGMVRISGIVPNGVTELGVDRHADGTIEETVPVLLNAFSVELDPVGVILHGIGDAKAAQIELKYPLQRLASANGNCGWTGYGPRTNG